MPVVVAATTCNRVRREEAARRAGATARALLHDVLGPVATRPAGTLQRCVTAMLLAQGTIFVSHAPPRHCARRQLLAVRELYRETSSIAGDGDDGPICADDHTDASNKPLSATLTRILSFFCCR